MVFKAACLYTMQQTQKYRPTALQYYAHRLNKSGQGPGQPKALSKCLGPKTQDQMLRNT